MLVAAAFPLTLAKKFRPPFQAFPRALTAGLLVACVGLNVALPCSDLVTNWGATAGVAVVCITLWANHVALVPLTGIWGLARLVVAAVYDLLALVLFVVLVSVPFPHYDCRTPRTKVAELILNISESRSTISERFERTHSLENIGQGLHIDRTQRVRWGLVTNEGMIVAASEDPPAVVILTPVATQSVLTWKCDGVPRNLLPVSCR